MSPTRYPSFAHRKQAAKRAEARDVATRRVVASWPDGRPPEENSPEITYAPGLLPDAPGYVHGIVQADPRWVIQCDGCGRVAVGESRNRFGQRSNLLILSAGIQFGHGRDPRRLCARCRVSAGWQDYDTQRCRDNAETLAFHEAYMQDRDPGRFGVSAHVKTDEERDEEVVERVAAAMWWQEFGYDRGVTWEQRVQQELDHRTDPSWSGPVARYRRLARAALSAIGSERNGSC